MSWSRTKNESNESRTRRAAYARATEARHPKPSEAPTHFGPPRAVRAACRNLVKHQRILGIPNLSATCGVRPLPALSVRYSRCPSATCAVKVQFAMSVRNLRYPSATGVASAGLVKTVTNTPLQKPSRTHAQEVYSSRFRACKNSHEHTLAKTVTNTRAGSASAGRACKNRPIFKTIKFCKKRNLHHFY